MKLTHIAIFVVLSLLFIKSGFSYDGSKDKIYIQVDNDRNLEFHSGSLFIYDEENDTIAEINPDFELYIRGKQIMTDKKDRKLLKAFYELSDEILQKSNKIAHKGAMIGLDGVALAAKAVGGVVVLIAEGCDEKAEEEFQDKIEAEARKIEEKAELIESDADDIENIVIELEEVNLELGQRIREWESLNLSFHDEN